MALVVVLSMLALVTIVGVAFTMFSMYESRNARNFLRAAQGDFLMNLAIGDAMHKIIAGTPQVGSNYYWVSAPGRIWRVGGVNTPGATNKLLPTSEFFTPSYSDDFDILAEESGFIDLFSEADPADGYETNKVGFGMTHSYVDLNAAQRGYKIAPDPNPSGLGGGRIPLTVQWVNVARDMTQPIGPDNPVVGRYAYWVDVENARVNINDVGVTNRTGWRGLSAQEFDPAPVGLNAADLNAYRDPQPVDVGSPNLPLTTYTNLFFFRRTEDLRLAGINEDDIKQNAFYLTAVGRDLEVDNAGRIPIDLDAYNGVYDPNDATKNATLPSHMGGGPVDRNHPMAVWADTQYVPRLAGVSWDPIISGGKPPTYEPFGPIVLITWDEYTNALETYNQPPYVNVVFDPDPSETDEFSFFGGSVSGEEEVPGTPGTQAPGFVADNFMILSPDNRSTNSMDWLLPRLMGTWRGSSFSILKPMSTGFDNRRTDEQPWDKSRDYDVVAMQRLTQTYHTNEPSWFVKLTATNNVQAPADNETLSLEGGDGKYTWNEFAQLLANINTWRQTNLPMLVRGDVTVTNIYAPDGTPMPYKPTITNPIPAGIMMGGMDVATIERFPAGEQPIVMNQNLGNRPLPYVNEVGISVYFSGGDVQRITLHLELWNPSYVSNGVPWNLGIVAIMPEAPYAAGWRGMADHPDRAAFPPPEYHDFSSFFMPPLAFSNVANLVGTGSDVNRFGNDRNPERFKSWTYRDMEGVVPVWSWAQAAVWSGSIWKSPPTVPTNPWGEDYFEIMGMANRNPQNMGVIFPAHALQAASTNQLGGGAMGFMGVTVAHKTYYLNRWHVPISTDSGRFVVLRDAHRVDWRVPQRLDISLLPDEAAYGNIGIVSDGMISQVRGNPDVPEGSPGWYAHPNDHLPGYLKVKNDGSLGVGFRINAAVAVGLMQITNGVAEVAQGTGIRDNFVSLAAGIRGNILDGTSYFPYAPFYQITPQPRVNPLDDRGSGMVNELYGIPQTKFLPFLNIKMSGGGPTYTASREVDDPRVNTRSAFVDFSRINSEEEDNLVNSYDANDWGPMYQDTTSGSLGTITTLPIMSYTKNDTYRAGAEYYETATGPLLTPGASGWRINQTIWPGAVGAINRSLTNVTTVNGWSTTGTNWNTALGGSKPRFSGWGDGDGDLTSQVYKMNDFEHPAELGYVHTGRPWRTLRFGRSYYGLTPDYNIKQVTVAGVGILNVTNTIDTTNSVPDWYLFDQFLSLSVVPDNVPQSWESLVRDTPFVGSSLGKVTNPRRGTMALNPTIYTAEHPDGVPANQARLKPLYSMLSGVASGPTLTNLVQAIYNPRNPIGGAFEAYEAGATADRYGIPGVIDSPGELSEVFGRFTSGTINASAPYTQMVTNLWTTSAVDAFKETGNWATGSDAANAWISTGNRNVMEQGWSGAGFSGGAVTLDATTSAFPKELLRAIGAQMSPRSRYFRVYVVAQSINNDRVTGEFWKEVLVERDNRYNENGLNASRPHYRVVWEKNL
ncbi:hypothetical protein QQ056_05715 [Oscillatoria laete-virens NRMC-F 0139]|nr:hypothetical protein [Oscillatoria laete-virens]MDL5053048.1 hypothetical protein [Oscillatoria laete-virens NRMC-F 0139]